MQYRKFIIVIGLLGLLQIFFVQCVQRNPKPTDPRGNEYAGSASCVRCHKDLADYFAHNNHFKTSSPVNRDSLSRWIKGNDDPFFYEDSSFVVVGENERAFIQSHIANGKPLHSAFLDIAIGSGEKAQSYGSWRNEQLFQLPLTYVTSIHRWTNSPGFPTSQPYFNRVILSRCFECHASYVEKKDIRTGALQVSEQLVPPSFVYGIDCERCHGSAAEHVKFHEENPGVKAANKIVSIKSLDRDRQLDLCASCHSGNDLDVQRTLFAFRPGDTLANFYFPRFGAGKEADVHGKQLQLLQASQCYIQSDMTCGTCHSIHGSDQTHLTIYSAKCLNCHQQGSHVLQMKTGKQDCITCHMPLQDSKKLIFETGTLEKRIPYYLRTHRIAVYPDNKEPTGIGIHSDKVPGHAQ
jgi:hypothetical protein